MAYEHSKSNALTTSGVTINKGNTKISAEQKVEISLEVPADSVDFLVDLDLVVARIQSLYIVCDGGNLTIQTNDGTTPADSLTLVDRQPYNWDTASYFANLFTTDITALYLTCVPAGVAIKFDLYALVDPTP